MKMIFKRRRNAFILSICTILLVGIIALAHNPIPYSIDWTNTNLITTDDVWSVSGELGVRGYSGADTPVVPGADARTVLPESLILDVMANQTDPNTLVEGGVAEFEIANPTIGLKGSDTAHAPYINLLVDSRELTNIRLRANVRDLDSTSRNAVQQVAVQFRTRDDETGPFTDVPSAYIADATQGGTATLVTPIDVVLPPEANGRTSLEIRVMTVNALGEDEWIGIDDIQVTAGGVPTPTPTPIPTPTPTPIPSPTPIPTPTPTPSPTPTPTPRATPTPTPIPSPTPTPIPTPTPQICIPFTTVSEGNLFPGGIVSFGVTSGVGSVTVDHVNAGTGLQSFTIVSATNATVNIPVFVPGTYAPVTATFTPINPALAVDYIVRAASTFHAANIRVRCFAPNNPVEYEDGKPQEQ